MDSTSRKNGSKYIYWELAAVLALWAISLLMSYYPYNRALDEADWVTAHTLLSLRALDSWGFFHLFGASGLVPYSHELQGADLTTFTKAEGIYLSYPSLWLIFPYAVFKIVSLFSTHYELTPSFIITYNLIINRLICGGVVYFIFRYLLDFLFNGYPFYERLGPLGQRLLAMTGLVGWMLPASAMVNTQNLYFSDQAVLLPLYCLFLFTLKHNFDFWNFRWGERVILGILSFMAVGMDWYGLIFLAVAFVSIAVTTYFNHKTEKKKEIYLKLIQNVVLPLGGGTALMLGFFLSQLIYFEDGFKQIIEIFTLRTGRAQEATQAKLSYLDIYSSIVDHWKMYLPKVERAALFGLDKFLAIPGAVTTLLFVFAPILAWLSTDKSARKLKNFAAFSLLYLAPCIQLLLLKQHSSIHVFSAFKMALPIAFSTCVLPAAYIIYLAGRFGEISITVRRATAFVMLSAYFLPFALKFPSSDYLISTRDRPSFASHSNSLYKDMGTFVHRELPSTAIVLSDNLKTDLGNDISVPLLPQRLWYTNRFVYSPKFFIAIKPKLQKDKIDRAKFIFVDYKDAVRQHRIEPRISKICSGKWFNYATLIEGRRIVGCNAQELKLALSSEKFSEG
jgi:hypothetical protein